METDAVVDRRGLDEVIAVLTASGHRVLGPVERDGAIVHAQIRATSDLPVGVRDRQEPGTYRLEHVDGGTLFDWAVGPASWKSTFFPPQETVWRASSVGGEVVIRGLSHRDAPVALFGARPCELAALGVLDRVLAKGAVPDPAYRQRRAGCFVVVVECGAPASTCFCASMAAGPGAHDSYDLAVTELPEDSRGADRRYLVRVGSPRGADVLAAVRHRPAGPDDRRRRAEVLAGASALMTRSIDAGGLPELMARNIDSPRWEETAERCLSCGNCTMVCPTCFCSDVHDVSDLDGTVERRRGWASCFDRDHSYIHGGYVRPTTASCYRQWLTHKLGTWWDQFGSSGCVGCGRCIAWCPVGIDITEEVAAIRDRDDAKVGAGSG
ncbi:MAG TPA: 4Fe-4S dicluster domain-containing protein [Acidimicrobiales bacterium]|nr:4Fe-4S dicluster domain-containing protein [Acidimicrobiales bacterium]